MCSTFTRFIDIKIFVVEMLPCEFLNKLEAKWNDGLEWILRDRVALDLCQASLVDGF